MALEPAAPVAASLTKILVSTMAMLVVPLPSMPPSVTSLTAGIRDDLRQDIDAGDRVGAGQRQCEADRWARG